MGAGSGGGFQGDLVAQRLELTDVVALGAVGTDAGVVEAGAEVVEAGLGVGQQVPGDDQDDRPTATIAFLAPRRRAMRRKRSPRKVWVRPAATAASPRTRAR